VYDERSFDPHANTGFTVTPPRENRTHDRPHDLEHLMAAILNHREAIQRQAPRPPLHLVTAPPSRRRPGAGVYRRRRLLAAAVLLAVVVLLTQVAGHVTGASASAGSVPSAPVVLVAQPGDSYWTLANQVHQGGDLRSTVDALVDANGGRDLRAGDRIELP
jgi:hypothetical protein